MIEWLYSIDSGVFRWANQSLAHPFLDRVMVFVSWNALFVPALILGAVLFITKGGRRGRVFVLMMTLAITIADPVVCSAIKRTVNRARPYDTIPETRLLVGKSHNKSWPSGHTTNWFAATTITFLYYKRIVPWVAFMAFLVGFSRMYLGVHYPLDVLGGIALGIGAALGVAYGANALWNGTARRWFPLWWMKVPSLLEPERSATPDQLSASARRSLEDEHRTTDAHWLRLGYVLLGVLLLARLAYIASGKILLSEDEAYQWLWSKHLALSYYSKPPLIAYTQFLGTSLWGDTELGVRFFSPVIAAVLGFLLLRFFARELNVKAGLALVLVITATPLMGVGATLMTIDPLSVLFWTAAMLSGWRAVREDSTKSWMWTGLWMGLGFLSKYIALFQWLCWALFFVLWKPARAQLRRPGPWLALGINLVLTLPVLIWNQQNSWITVTHLANRGGLDATWSFKPQFIWDFFGAEMGLLNPVFFVGAIWAAIAFWKRFRNDPLLLFLFSMGAPLFLFYAAYTLRSRVLPNWIAPSVLPLFCLMVAYWCRMRSERPRLVAIGLRVGLAIGLPIVILLHDTNLIQKIASVYLPPKIDPLVRVRNWKEMSASVGGARTKLLTEGKPVFIIGGHYGITGLLSFYLPEAKAAVKTTPLVYYQSSEHPENQFYFWPGYGNRKGENAIYAQRVKGPIPVPERLRNEFESVTDLGVQEVLYRGRVFHRIQLFECRGLK
jgi:4-amino-4-deoxy-L-arabinose transferase-like glycosyltransferase/membrane-associated phospholipid phosphatase